MLIDPVDGTRELVAGRDEFTINVAVVSSGRPVLGIIAAPARGLIWRTACAGGAERMRLAPGADVDAAQERTAIRTRPYDGGVLIAAISRSHLDAQTQALLARWPEVERIASGSAIKLCWVADGTVRSLPAAGADPGMGPRRRPGDRGGGGRERADAGGTAVLYGRSAEEFPGAGLRGLRRRRVADALFL